jgi:hypothetical protein
MRTVGPLCGERFGLTSLGMLNVGRHRRLPITGQVGLVLCRKPALRAGKLQLWPGCPCRTPNIDRHWPRFACRTRYENGVDGMNCCVCHRRTPFKGCRVDNECRALARASNAGPGRRRGGGHRFRRQPTRSRRPTTARLLPRTPG